jgi:hypothetical protein
MQEREAPDRPDDDFVLPTRCSRTYFAVADWIEHHVRRAICRQQRIAIFALDCDAACSFNSYAVVECGYQRRARARLTVRRYVRFVQIVFVMKTAIQRQRGVSHILRLFCFKCRIRYGTIKRLTLAFDACGQSSARIRSLQPSATRVL